MVIPRLLAAIDPDGEFVWGISFNLPGKPSRWELHAIVHTRRKAEDDSEIEFITDNLGCCNTYNGDLFIISARMMSVLLVLVTLVWPATILPILKQGLLLIPCRWS